MTSLPRIHAIGTFALLAILASPAVAQIVPSPFATLNSNSVTDTNRDAVPRIATDAQGHWVAVWVSQNNLFGGITRDADIHVARSSDNGVTWSFPELLNLNGVDDGATDDVPQITTDGLGHWVAVWQSSANLNGTAGTDGDIFVARSSDNGETWSQPALLNSNGTSDTGKDEAPQIAADGAGHWVAVWHSNQELNETTSFDTDIFVARSSDNGATWSAPALLRSDAIDGDGNEKAAQIATDRDGVWIAVWQSTDNIDGTVISGFDIISATSTDNGVTWTAPRVVSATAENDLSDAALPHITTDAKGHWLAVWDAFDIDASDIGTDGDIRCARSTDNGETWTTSTLVNTTGSSDNRLDDFSEVATDSDGNWIAVWRSAVDIGGSGNDEDVYAALSTNNGVSWAAPVLLNSYGTADSVADWNPSLTADGLGNWIGVWQANTDPTGTANSPDGEAVVTRFTLGEVTFATLRGIVAEFETDAPVVNAAVTLEPLAGGAWIVTATDLTGRYRTPILPLGNYAVTVYAPGYASQSVTMQITQGAAYSRNFHVVDRNIEGKVVGFVTDATTSLPVVGARVDVTVDALHFVTFTNADGAYDAPLSLAKANVSATVEISAENYTTDSTEEQVDNAATNDLGTTVLASTLPNDLEVSGTVTMAGTSDAISGARVTIFSGVNRTVFTDVNGDYAALMPAGELRIDASAVDHKGAQATETANADTTVNFALEAGVQVIDFRDVNGDGEINAVDIQFVINAALGITVVLDCDANGDGFLNAVDVQRAINGALGGKLAG